jgi:hypothetical protein
MASKRERSVSYRRAEWFAEASGLTLEKCIRDANKALTTVEARTINRGGQHTSIAKAQDASSGGLYLHITADTPGEAASVVPKAKTGATVVDLKTEKPPPGTDARRGRLPLFAGRPRLHVLDWNSGWSGKLVPARVI